MITYGSMQTQIAKRLKALNPKTYRQLELTHELQPLLKEKTESAMMQLDQLTKAGFQELEAMEIIREDVMTSF
ncbi:hypothetical protein BCS42_03895 [Crenothrix sp. D3]|nr:hypothetical protein BCS42_03895 [Crenothrix sp. D3]